MYQNIIASAREIAARSPDQNLLTYLRDGEDDAISQTSSQFDLAARSIAGALLKRGLRGQRVIIALPSGLDYASAVMGCFYAGAIAVPCSSITREADWPRVRGVAANCAPRLGIIHSGASAKIMAEIQGMPWVRIDEILAETPLPECDVFSPQPHDIAFLQYTSGSTGVPKGTQITHRNLAHNSWLIGLTRDERPYQGVCWLPPHHDMGLVGGLLHAFYSRQNVVLMSPLHFLQRPIRWLRAITKYGATQSPAPDFAFRYCVDRITPEERSGLDLSRWEIAYSGAEPIRKRTLDLFAETYAPFGFRRETFLPCYGLAESTLIVSAKPWKRSPSEFVQEGGRTLIGSGNPLGDTEVKIIDPKTLSPLPENQAGEIWVRSPSVASGYWGRSDDRDVFGARIGGDTQGEAYLRTGDIGFIRNGELFVTGRERDLILIRGRNLHAEDVEATALESHSVLSHAACAAVAIESESAETLGIILEVDPRIAGDFYVKIVEAVRSSVVKIHGVLPERIVIVRRGSLPRTSSGKLRRFLCAESLQNASLPLLYEQGSELS
jgi:acyl-CoA synthetase (AMP-forming)/AMP-acid ligase II